MKNEIISAAVPSGLVSLGLLDAASFEGLPIVGWTAPGLLGLAIFMLMTGKLWTNSAYQEKRDDAAKWQAAYEAEREARKESDTQTKELLEITKTTHAFIVAVFSNSEKIRQSGVPDVVSKS